MHLTFLIQLSVPDLNSFFSDTAWEVSPSLAAGVFYNTSVPTALEVHPAQNSLVPPVFCFPTGFFYKRIHLRVIFAHAAGRAPTHWRHYHLSAKALYSVKHCGYSLFTVSPGIVWMKRKNCQWFIHRNSKKPQIGMVNDFWYSVICHWVRVCA